MSFYYKYMNVLPIFLLYCNTMRVRIWISINLHLYIILTLISLFILIYFLFQIHPLVLLPVNLNTFYFSKSLIRFTRKCTFLAPYLFLLHLLTGMLKPIASYQSYDSTRLLHNYLENLPRSTHRKKCNNQTKRATPSAYVILCTSNESPSTLSQETR